MKKPVGGESDKPRALSLKSRRTNSGSWNNNTTAPRLRSAIAFTRTSSRRYARSNPALWRRPGEHCAAAIPLKATLHLSMKRVLDRNDLSVGRKTNAREDADLVMWLFDELQRKDLGPKEMRGHAYELATRTLFIGLRGGLTSREVESLHTKFMSDRQRKLGATPKKEKPWRRYAKMLALKIPEKDRTLSNAKLEGMLWDMWTKEKPAEWTEAKPARPSIGTLASFVGRLRTDGTFPPGPIHTRRPRG